MIDTVGNLFEENTQLKKDIHERNLKLQKIKEQLNDCMDSLKRKNDSNKSYRDTTERLKKELADKKKELQQLQTQKAIECLKEVKEDLLDISNGYWKCFAKYGQQYMTSDDLEECLKEYIDTKIKELEGEKE